MSGALITYVAEAVPFDNGDNFYDSENVKDALIENDFRELVSEPTGFPSRTDSTISFVDGTRTFTIQPSGADFFFYSRGKKFIVSGPVSIQITDTAGTWWFYFDTNGAFNASQTQPSHNTGVVEVGTIIWSVTDQEHSVLIDQRYGLVMDHATVTMLERMVGVQISPQSFTFGNFLINGDGSSNTHAQFSLTAGFVHSHDFTTQVIDAPTPSADYEQTLGGIAKIPLFYRSGPTGEIRMLSATEYAMATNSPNTPFWNEWTGSTWQLSNIPDGRYASTIIAITKNRLAPVVGIIPQFHSDNAVDATKDVFLVTSFGDVNTQELYPHALVVYESKSTFTNTPRARYVAISRPEGLARQTDRYAVLAVYTGNANTGRYLEVIPGDGSDTSPFYVPDDSFIRTVTLQTKAIDTYSVGFFRISNLTTPILTLSVTSSASATFDVSTLVNAGNRIAVRITSGSCNTPAVRFWIQTSSGI